MDDKKNSRRAVGMGITYLVFALLTLGLFVPGTTGDQLTTFTFNVTAGGLAPIPDLTFHTLTGIYLMGALALLAGVWQLTKGFKNVYVVLGLVTGTFVLAFLAWAARDKSMNLTGMIGATLLSSIPITLAALSGVMCERSGVVNIGIEGMMLSGAFMSALIGSVTQSYWWGLLAAVLAGGLTAALLAVMAIKYKVDQIVAGTSNNILTTGLTSYFSSRYLQTNGALNHPPTFNRFSLPILGKIPIVGPSLFNNTLLVYAAIVLVFVIYWMLFYTRWGLRTRAVGNQCVQDALHQRHHRWHDRRARWRVSSSKLCRPLRRTNDRRKGLHWTGRDDLRELESHRSFWSLAHLRLRRLATNKAGDSARPHPIPIPVDGSLSRHDDRAGRCCGTISSPGC